MAHTLWVSISFFLFLKRENLLNRTEEEEEKDIEGH
jgi:hypothetical protein